jgi:hypothetical protein
MFGHYEPQNRKFAEENSPFENRELRLKLDRIGVYRREVIGW